MPRSKSLQVDNKKVSRSKSRSKDNAEKPKRKFKGKIFLFVVLIIVIYLVFTFAQVYWSAKNDQVTRKTRTDAIVILGAAQFNGKPSNVLKARLDHGLSLYKSGVAPIIIVTGGNQPGDRTTEAAASANYLLERGVSDSNILREVQGVSTFDSLRDTAAFSKERGIETVVIVTDGFHEKRASLIAKDFGLKVVTSPANDSPIKGADEWKYFFTETARISAGRIIGFRRVSKDSTLAGFVK